MLKIINILIFEYCIDLEMNVILQTKEHNYI